MAEIVRPHGVRGDLLAQPHSDNVDRFLPGSELLLRQPSGTRRVVVEKARRHQDRLLLKLDAAASRDEAELLRGATLEVSQEDVPPAPEGTYWFFELVGCACHDRELGPIGEVVDVLEDGGGLLLELERQCAGGPERFLVPFVEAYVVAVDTAAGRLETRLPEGLIESCASTS